jgi:hypothetical protein
MAVGANRSARKLSVTNFAKPLAVGANYSARNGSVTKFAIFLVVGLCILPP